jgi:hypothetical protein
MKTQFKPFKLSALSIEKRLAKHCENQPLNKWLLVRHIFDVTFIGHIPSKKAFDFMLELVSKYADEWDLKIEKQTVGDWDFIRFVQNDHKPSQP